MVTPIFVLSIIDVDNILFIQWSNIDKHLHLFVFAMFMIITKSLFNKLSILKISIILFCIGLFIELLQRYLGNGLRYFSILDVLYNCLGMLIGAILIYVFYKAFD